MDNSALMEAIRRRQGMGASGAGIPGGAQAANSASPANPIAQAGMNPMSRPTSSPSGAMPTAENPNAGAIDMMQKSQPGESQIIIKALIQRLKQNPVT